MVVGYVRVSTEDQNEARQLQDLKDAERIFTDKASGKDMDRPAFREMMAFVRSGDTLVVESISRLARSTRDLLKTVDELEGKGVQLVSLKENLDTKTTTGRFVLTIFAALAEMERETIRERQAEGIRIAKAAGKYKGRAPIRIDEKQFRRLCNQWRAGDLKAVDVMRMTGLKPNTFYRRVRDLGL